LVNIYIDINIGIDKTQQSERTNGTNSDVFLGKSNQKNKCMEIKDLGTISQFCLEVFHRSLRVAAFLY
jgi:hypothetical protein